VPANTLYAIVLFANASGAMLLLLWAWRRSGSQPTFRYFAAIMIGVAIWCVMYALDMLSPELETKYLMTKIEYLGIAPTPTIAALFMITHAGYGWLLNRRNLALLLMIPVTTILLMWTNDFHHLVYVSISLKHVSGFDSMVPMRGAWFWIHAVYSYLMLFAGSFLLLRNLIRSQEILSGQALNLLIAVVVPWMMNITFLTGNSPFPGLDLTPFSFTITGLAMGWNLFRFRLLDVIPAARELVMESLPSVVMVVDSARQVVDINPAAREMLSAMGFTKVIGENVETLLADQPEIIAELKKQTHAHTLAVVSVGDQKKTYEVQISPIRPIAGMVSGYLLLLHDITRLKQTEEELSQARDSAVLASRVKSRIIAAVSHDFRTPLTSIMGFADMLLVSTGGSSLSERQRDLIRRMQTNSQHLSNLVNSLLDQAQIEGGKLTLHLSLFTPQQIVEVIESLYGSRAKEQGLKLVTRIEAEVPSEIKGDRTRIAQVIGNLVENALKFTTEGEISVRIAMNGKARWSVHVRDTGQGIPEEDQAHIFDPFWQGEEEDMRSRRGVGLGLSIVSQVTQAMEGSIRLESQPGQGTTFTLEFPVQTGIAKVP
jgi:PAS domain S-box-containing protein